MAKCGQISKYRGSFFKWKALPVSLMITCEEQLPCSQLGCTVNGINIFRPVYFRDKTASYSNPFLCTSVSKIRSFHYWIFQTIGASLLSMKMGVKERKERFFYDSKPKRIKHLFLYCDPTFPFWTSFCGILCSWCILQQGVSNKTVIQAKTK